MVRFPGLVVAGALTLVVTSSCGGASHERSAVRPSGNFPIVVAHPSAQSITIPRTELRRLERDGALLLPPSRVAFITTGSVSCAWWPARLAVLGRSSIRIDMRVNGQVSRCGAGAVGFPIAVKIDPQVVDVHRPMAVRLAYKVGRRQWHRAVVAPAISRS